MLDKNSAGSAADRTDLVRLMRLAQLLGCEPEDLVSATGSPIDLTALAELLRLLLAIEAPDDREQLLDLARQLAVR